MNSAGCVMVLDGQWRHALSVTRSLGKKGIRTIVGDSSKIALSKFSKYCCQKITYPDPKKFPENFIDYLVRFSQQEKVDLIIPNADYTVGLLAKHKKQFDNRTKIPLADYRIVSKALDKAQTMQIALENDVPLPKTYFIEDVAEVPKLANEIEYPVIIKPRESSGAIGLKKVFSRDDFLKHFYGVHKDFPFPIVQDFIPGPNKKHNFCAILDSNCKTKAAFVMEHLRLYPYDGGVGTYARSVKHPAVAKYGLKFLKALRWYGIAQVEFKIDPRDNLPKLLEVNPRFWGMTEMAVCSGLDLPYILYRMVVYNDETEYVQYRCETYLRWLLPGDILHFLSNPNRRSILREFLRFSDKNLHYAIISRDDPVPILGTLIAGIFGLSNSYVRRLVFRK